MDFKPVQYFCMEPKTIINSLDEINNFVKRLISYLTDQGKNNQVISLSGNLGAGKTTLVQFLAKELGVHEQVTSPTFTIMKNYQIAEGKQFKNLIHVDAYRIDSLDELRPLGFAPLLTTPGNLVCIEWAEKIASFLPKDTIYLTLVVIDEQSREISFSLEAKT